MIPQSPAPSRAYSRTGVSNVPGLELHYVSDSGMEWKWLDLSCLALDCHNCDEALIYGHDANQYSIQSIVVRLSLVVCWKSQLPIPFPSSRYRTTGRPRQGSRRAGLDLLKPSQPPNISKKGRLQRPRLQTAVIMPEKRCR